MMGSSKIKSDTLVKNLSSDMIPMYQNVTTTVKVKGKEVIIYGINTGTVAIKTAFKRKKGAGELAKLNILLDRHFTNYLPIWVWVIAHPEGLILIDTGENADINDIDTYLSQESWFHRFPFKHAAKFGIRESDALDHQFDKMNLKLTDVQLVVLTHLHLDHTDGLRFFPKQEIIVGDHEFRNPNSNMPSTYPAWFHPNRVHYLEDQIEVFDKAYPITSAQDLLYIPTPGHTAGHSSVIFKTDDFDIIFAGDTSYNQEQVLKNELAGVNVNYKQSAATYKKLKTYATIRRTIYLPTHDENAGQRLLQKNYLL